MTDRLSLYNGALRHLSERHLASLAENREPRRLLDDAWDAGAVRACLEQGLWNFATRTVRLEYSPDVEPEFGYRYAFEQPDDFVRLAAVAADEYLRSPITRYSDEAGFWFCDLPEIYVGYVSDDELYGLDFSRWPRSFSNYVEGHLAEQAAKGDAKDRMAKKVKSLLKDARSKDALNEGAKFLPPGTWSSSRRGTRSDRAGPRLIG